MPALSLRGLTKSYESVLAVRSCTLDLWPGQIMGFVGPNGAGKTTTMRCVCGILSPTSGRVRIAGHDLGDDPIGAKASLAYIPDDPKLFDALTVWEHLEFAAAAYRVAGWKPKAEALLDRFELAEKRKALTMELSRGMRQKLAIACGYLHDPALILLDEPLTGLDPMGIRVMKESMRERAAAGAALLVSSHLLALVEDLVTHVLIVVKGEQRFVGTTAEARTAFATREGAALEEVFFSATADRPTDNSTPANGS